jgi:serine/threonine protein phosphatase 1
MIGPWSGCLPVPERAPTEADLEPLSAGLDASVHDVPQGGAMPRFARNERGRDFAVGDIHGCFTALARGLDSISFDPAVDRLFSVGDLVDRGPESLQALEWLDKPWFHAICGNHDFMAWRSALGIPYREVSHALNGGGWLEKVAGARRSQLGRQLRALPLALEVETSLGLVGMVHADCPFDDWREMQQVAWAGIDQAGTVAHCCLWSVERYTRQYASPVKNVRAVLHGHMTVRYVKVLGNVYFIDTGGWKPDGCFSFLDLESLKTICGPTNSPAPGKKNR